MRSESERLAWLDLLRVAAAAAVVFLHVSAEPVAFVRNFDSTVWRVGNVVDSASRWCIGVFVMVSGALLLDPSRRESARAFFGKRMQRIFIPLCFWSLAYFAFGAAVGLPMGPARAAELLWHGRPWYHLWYLFMTVGLYAITPPLRAYIVRSSASLRWTVVVLSLTLASGWDLYLAIQAAPIHDLALTMFIPYIGYYLLGFELRTRAPCRLHPALLWGGFGLAVLVTAVGTRVLVGVHGTNRLGLYMYEYLSPNVIVMSVAVFSIASRSRVFGSTGPRTAGVLTTTVAWIAPLTLGIYLFHPIPILLLRRLGINPIQSGGVFGILLVAVPAFLVSLLLTRLMAAVPVLRRTVGLR